MARTIYQEGRDAQGSGVSGTSKCPYREDGQRMAWFEGFKDARREADKAVA